MGKCPKCDKMVGRITGESVEIDFGINKTKWIGNMYLCPSCRTVLGCQIDPIAIKTDLKAELFEALRKGSL